jgi:hypothetical protein
MKHQKTFTHPLMITREQLPDFKKLAKERGKKD